MMNVVFKLVFGTIAVMGLAVAVTAAYLLVSGPFLGGAVLDPVPTFGALAGFIVGIVVAVWGGVRALGIGARL